MGLFSWLGSVAKNVVESIGKELTPSKLLQSAVSIAGVVAEVIPGVGPIVGHAIPVLNAIFSETGRTTTENSDYETTKLASTIPTISSTEMTGIQVLDDALIAIRDSRDTTINSLSLDDADKPFLNDVHSKLEIGITYFHTHKQTLKILTPNDGYNRFMEFMHVDDNDTKLMTIRDSLSDTAVSLTTFLSQKLEDKIYTNTAAATDFYISVVSWQLIYDKVVNVNNANLRALLILGYMARCFIMDNDTERYLKCMDTWNAHFTEARSHVHTALDFLLGKDVGIVRTSNPEDPGFLFKMRTARMTCISMAVDTKSVVDLWPETALGYCGAEGKDGKKLPTERPETLPVEFFEQSCVALYKTANYNYFDLSTQNIVDITEKWQDALVKWNNRLPLVPPRVINEDGKSKAAVHVKTSLAKLKKEDRDGDLKFTGYSQGTSIRYALSYVSAQSDGILSSWSPPVAIPNMEDICVELEVHRSIPEHSDPVDDYDAIEQKSGNGVPGKGLGILRRVYARYTEKGKPPREAWIADMMPHETKLKDCGINSHGLLNNTSRAVVPDSGGLPEED